MAAGMDHAVETPDELTTEIDVRADWARATIVDRGWSPASSCGGQVRRLRLVEPALACPRCATRWTARCRARRDAGWERLRRGAARTRSTSSGTARTSRSTATGEIQQAVRFGLFHVLPGRGARRAAGDPGQGADRPRLRRARVLGHRDASCCRCSPRPRRRRGATRCAGGTRRSTWPASAPQTLGCAGAAFPWRTIRGQECSALLAGRHRRVPRQRRHRVAAARYVGGPATRTSSGTAGCRAAGRDRAAVDVAGLPRRGTGASTSTASPGPDEYSASCDDNIYTNLMARANLRAAAEAASRHAESAGRPGGRRRRRSPAGARGRRRSPCPYDDAARRAPAGRGLHRPRAWDFERHDARDGYPLLLHCPVLRPLPQAGGQAGRPGAGDALVRGRVHAPRRRRATSTTTSAAPCATPRCRPAPRR